MAFVKMLLELELKELKQKLWWRGLRCIKKSKENLASSGRGWGGSGHLLIWNTAWWAPWPFRSHARTDQYHVETAGYNAEHDKWTIGNMLKMINEPL